MRPPPLPLGITEDSGGHLTYVWGAADALAKRDDITEAELVTRLFDDPALGAEYALPQQPCGPKLRITRIDSGNRRYLSKEASAADRPAFIAALLADLAARPVRPDVVHAHFADAAEVAIAIRDRFGIPFVYNAHSLGIDKADHEATSADLEDRIGFEDRAIASADAIIASSRDEAERQLMRYPSADAAKIHRVPPGAALQGPTLDDTARARDMVAPFLRDPAKPIILAIARPVQKKNLGLLVDLYGSSPALREAANLVVVAGLRDGPDSGEREQRDVIGQLLSGLDQWNLYGALALPKRHEQSDIASLYALARDTGGLFVNPAATEPFGLTLTEAALHGVPVVATCHGGAADIVAEIGHGISVDPADGQAFVAAMLHLLSDRAAWSNASTTGRGRVRAYSWERYAERFVDIARGLMSPVSAILRPRDLLLSDIDGTLTGCREGARRLQVALDRDPRRMFGIATGRSLQEAQRILGDWHYRTPSVLVTSVGSEIYWRRGARLERDDGYARHLDHGWEPVRIRDALAGLDGLIPQAAVEQRRFKISYFADEAASRSVSQRLAEAGLAARVIHSHGNLLDILPLRGGKAAAMRWVAHRLSLPLSSVFAAGDSGNDRDMLEACPRAILVANHCPTVADLSGRENVYRSATPHAGGIVEAFRAYAGADEAGSLAA
ncbi:HAD-IIB family hydrolase [Sphingomonas glaciei]|uniref:sucrose-phosphate synthase n=1 Tax=Sphingomonas glaciei TaxID=2938948 RepID=A0ABY5MUJ3_9SPHN|nr:HAD-IIB family hydrolase [Sphingomonas glaciei]UUR08112.1 HAD-IIB family hydrolase [Sphingomonas glaciei]